MYEKEWDEKSLEHIKSLGDRVLAIRNAEDTGTEYYWHPTLEDFTAAKDVILNFADKNNLWDLMDDFPLFYTPLLKDENLNGFDIISEHNITDLRPDAEKELRRLLESGKEFDTGFCRSKGSETSLRVRREDGKVLVCVEVELAELFAEYTDDKKKVKNICFRTKGLDLNEMRKKYGKNYDYYYYTDSLEDEKDFLPLTREQFAMNVDVSYEELMKSVEEHEKIAQAAMIHSNEIYLRGAKKKEGLIN